MRTGIEGAGERGASVAYHGWATLGRDDSRMLSNLKAAAGEPLAGCKQPARSESESTTTIAAATQIYLRYDGEIATGTDNHALNIGVRMSW